MNDDSPWQPPAGAVPPPPPAPARVVPPPPPASAVPPPSPASAVPPPPLARVVPPPPPPRVVPPPPPVQAIPPTPTAPTVVVLPPVPSPQPAPVLPAAPWAPNHVPTAAAFSVDTEIETIRAGSNDRPRRSKLVVGGAVMAILAVGVAGVFAVSRFSGSSNGGAATPDELGLALLTAMENEDILGAVDVLVPGERDVFRDPLVDFVTELTRLEVLSPDASLSQIAGLDIVLEDEVVVVESTNVPDIVNIDLRATAMATIDGKLLPVGNLIKDNLSVDDRRQLDELGLEPQPEPEDLDFSVTAVEQDGRWYFSVFHSIAEVVRADALPDSGIPLVGIGASGADSPEAAFDELLNRVEQLDVRGVLQSLNPGEAAALQRYAPLFIDELEQSRADVPFEIKITERDIRVEGDGDSRTVFIDGLGVEGTIDGEPFSASFSGECFEASFGEVQIDDCVSTMSGIDEAEEFFAETPEIETFLKTLGDALADIEPAGIELRQHEGQWFVSPVSTFTEGVLNLLRALTRQELDDIIETGRAASDAFFDGIFGSDVYMDETFEDLSADDPLFEDSFDDTAVEEMPVSEDSQTGPEINEEAAVGYSECFSEFDAALATACFDRYIATGEIDASYLPVELRFPECGYQVAWGGKLQSLPDAEFIAAVEAVRPCFLDLVAKGLVEEWELGYEITHLECFEGRNWYNVFDDPAYDERYSACIDQALTATGATTGG